MKGPFIVRLYYEYKPTDKIKDLKHQDKFVYDQLIAEGRTVDFYPLTIIPSLNIPVFIYYRNYSRKNLGLSSSGGTIHQECIIPNLKWVTNLKENEYGDPSYTQVCAYF